MTETADPVNISFPDLIKLEKLVYNLKLKNNNKANQLFSNNITKALGRGMEYAESRIYQPGDDVRHIDWRLSARHSKTYSKLYHEEKGENIFVILNLSNSMVFGSSYSLKAVTAAKVAALISWLSIADNNSLGALIITNSDINFMPPKLGRKNILQFFNLIIKNFSTSVSHTQTTINTTDAINNYFKLINNYNRIFIISDFLDTDSIDNSFNNLLAKLTSKNLVYLLRIIDPLENDTLPTGYYKISNGQSATTLHINKNNINILKDFFATKLKQYNIIKNNAVLKKIEILNTRNWYKELWGQI